MTFGVDFSHWDGAVNWDAAKRAGVQFAFCKASQGVDFVDEYFARNYNEALRVGIPMGAYHYYLPSVPPINQAIHFCTVAPACCGLPHVVDLEATRGISGNFGDQVHTCLAEIEAETGHKPIIYTSYDWWNKRIGDVEWALDYPLWIANYRSQSGPLVPLPWHPLEWAIWQYSEKGNAARYGSRKKSIDLNIANIGALEALSFEPDEEPPAPPPAARLYASPVGTDAERASGAIWPGDWFDANPYLTYYNGSYHTGADLNKNLPTWNVDAGAPVHSMAAGVVTFAGVLPGTWGNVVVVQHDPIDGAPLYSRYAHLATVNVIAGDLLDVGAMVGTIGTMPGKPGWEHLHFDVSVTDVLLGDPGHWPGSDRAAVVANYVDPAEWLRENG